MELARKPCRSVSEHAYVPNRYEQLTDRPAELRTEPNIQIEIGAATISGLIARGVICVADVRCLNRDSKERLKEICLDTCIPKL